MAVSRSRRARAAVRRKRRLDRMVHDLTDAQWAELLAAWGGCAYCRASGVPLQRDCVLPIARGGRYTLANVVPACRSCNASKCSDEVTGWLRRKRLDERAFLERFVEVGALLAPAASGLPPAASALPGSPQPRPTGNGLGTVSRKSRSE